MPLLNSMKIGSVYAAPSRGPELPRATPRRLLLALQLAALLALAMLWPGEEAPGHLLLGWLVLALGETALWHAGPRRAPLAASADPLQLQALVARSCDWYWQTDAEHRLASVEGRNAALARKLGRTWWQLSGLRRDIGATREALRLAFESRQGFREQLVELREGSDPPRWLRLSAVPRTDRDGRFAGHHGMAADITESIQDRDRVRHMAYHDVLTGLPNRRLLTDRLTQALAHARRDQARVAIVLLELGGLSDGFSDGLRRIDDAGGQAEGARVLTDTAQRLRGCVRASDTVARLGGDTFAVLFADIANSANAADTERLAAKLAGALGTPPGARAPGVCMGVAVFPDEALTPDSLLELADNRLYLARRRGGG